MSLIIDDVDHETVVRQELQEIREQLQVIAMILREAFDVEIETGDIEDDQ